MPRIDVPAGRDPLLHLWSGTGNKLTGPAAAFSDAVVLGDRADPGGAALTAREALAAESARRFALDHLGLDDAFWERPHAAFGVDEACQIPLAPHGPVLPSNT